MNQIIEQIEKIKQINASKSLVIFVGAGISRNSGVCSWWDLIREISDIIDENKCPTCMLNKIMCEECGKQVDICNLNGDDCKLKYNFSTEDFLRIPQHYYDSLEYPKDEYYQLLKDKFCRDEFKPNIIDEIIVKLQPEHIITTNYDHLLEDVNDPSVAKYAIIANDDDMLSKLGRHYIIKMHGDIDDIKNIVLKEDDYLNYSQKHIIIETFIKSLLIDKTFLFVGYSLNDNNLKLIMSYIDFFVKEKKIENRQPHYLVVDQIEALEREKVYWENKGVELVDLSNVTDYMIENLDCTGITTDIGRKLYAFLNYLYSDTLAYTNDKCQLLNIALEKLKVNGSCFKYISYKTIVEAFRFKSVYGMKTPILSFTDKDEYKSFKILVQDKEVRKLLVKTGILGICLETDPDTDEMIFEDEDQEYDELFELFLQNKYDEIMKHIEKEPSSSEKAYYYSLITYTDGLLNIMDDLKEKYENFDYRTLSNEKCYELAIYEFNNTCIKLLLYWKRDSEAFNRLNLLLDTAAARYSKAYNTLKDITDKGSDIQEMNDILLKHEEYYMKKSSVSKIGGTVYGDLFKIRQIVYDYYLFYKKNHLMLDWFNNVEKMLLPYIKAIFCTYYPDEFQADSYGLFERTYVKPYPLELVDLDMIIKHIKLKDLRNITSHYKVDSIKLTDKIDISLLFENFCLSMKRYWNIRMIEQLKSFSFLLSLCKLNKEQNIKIVKSFIALLTPSEEEGIRTITNNIDILWIYVDKHFDEAIKEYAVLLDLLINSDILLESNTNLTKYPNLISELSSIADDKLYTHCCNEIEKIKNNNHKKSFFVFSTRKILLRYNRHVWSDWIREHIDNNSDYEIFQLLYEKIVIFDDKMKKYYEEKMKTYIKDDCTGVSTYPNYKTEMINNLIILVLLECINENDIVFMKEYIYMSDYLEFMFEPESFDYKKIKLSDIMWCNFINNEKYRKPLLDHKEEFWNKDEEKRINLGFGSTFENRVAYKYLFD